MFLLTSVSYSAPVRKAARERLLSLQQQYDETLDQLHAIVREGLPAIEAKPTNARLPEPLPQHLKPDTGPSQLSIY